LVRVGPVTRRARACKTCFFEKLYKQTALRMLLGQYLPADLLEAVKNGK